MRAGDLRHRVTLQRPVESREASGEILTVYQDYLTVWAAIEPISGREYFAAQQVQSDATARIRIRYRPGINERLRVRHSHGGSPSIVDLYDVEAVIEKDARRDELILMVRKRGADGFRTVGANGE